MASLETTAADPNLMKDPVMDIHQSSGFAQIWTLVHPFMRSASHARAPATLHGLAATGRRKGAPNRLKAFMAAMVIVRSTRSFDANAAEAAA